MSILALSEHLIMPEWTSEHHYAMILIDCKIIIFSLHLFIYFFCNNYNIGEPTSATSKERMTTNIIFVGAHTY